MHLFILLAFMLAAPYWETKPARHWNDEELMGLLRDSPWAQVTSFRETAEVPVYIASAKPLRDAEAEIIRRYTLKLGANAPKELPARREYELFLADNLGKVIVIAIRNPNLEALAVDAEIKQMEESSFLRVGRKKLKMTGHFPPAESDPVLRLVFPRPADLGKDLSFEMYIPGVTGPYRQAIFRIKDLMFQGQLEL
jgi:hypothetical protein